MDREVMYFVVSTLKLFPFKKCTYVKEIKSVVIYLCIFINLFIQTYRYYFYMLVNWFLLVHTCLQIQIR